MRTFPAFVGALSFLAAMAVASCSGSDGPTIDGGAPDAHGRPDSSVPEPEPDAGDYEAGERDVHQPMLDGSTPKCSGTNGIQYCGGPVISGGLGVYLVWYGAWAEPRKGLVREFVAGLNDSPWMAIGKTYCDSTGACVSGSVDLRGEVDVGWQLGDGGPKGIVWEDSKQAAIAIVSSAIVSQKFPADPGASFVVMVSAEQRSWDGPCTDWCGWHDRFALEDNDVKVSVVWDPSGCIDACTAFTWVLDAGGRSPNGDVAVDGLVSVLAHELAETASDPDLNAWSTGGFWENADMCAWTFGDTYPAANGAPANVRLGQRDWLVQRNWVNADGGYCALALP